MPLETLRECRVERHLRQECPPCSAVNLAEWFYSGTTVVVPLGSGSTRVKLRYTPSTRVGEYKELERHTERRARPHVRLETFCAVISPTHSAARRCSGARFCTRAAAASPPPASPSNLAWDQTVLQTCCAEKERETLPAAVSNSGATSSSKAGRSACDARLGT